MGLATLREFLRQHRRIGLDTSVFVYQVERTSRYYPVTDTILRWLERPGNTAVTSTLTMTELLVKPYRDGNQPLVDAFYGVLSTYPNLLWIAPSLEIADLAARLRARFRLRTPDALQIASAMRTGTTAFVTNDRAFERVDGMKVLVLDDIV